MREINKNEGKTILDLLFQLQNLKKISNKLEGFDIVERLLAAACEEVIDKASVFVEVNNTDT